MAEPLGHSHQAVSCPCGQKRLQCQAALLSLSHQTGALGTAALSEDQAVPTTNHPAPLPAALGGHSTAVLDETAIGTESDPQTGQALSPPEDERPATSGADPATPGSAVSLSCGQLSQEQTGPTEPQRALQASQAVPQAAWDGLGWRGSAARDIRALPEGSRAVELAHWSMAQPDGDDLEAGGERGWGCEVAR